MGKNFLTTLVDKFYSLSTKKSLIFFAVVCVGFIGLALFFIRSGELHDELYTRIPLQLSNRPFFTILFDQKLDVGYSRPRQVSYIFDILDANFIDLSIRYGFPHFLSLTHYLFSLIIGFVFWKFFTNNLKINSLLSVLITGIMFTSPSFIFGMAFRTAKIGVALCAALLLILVYLTFSSEEKWSRRKCWFIFIGIIILGFAATGFDEQGIFCVVLAFGISFVLSFIIRSPNRWWLVSALGGSLVLAAVFILIIYPQVIYSIYKVYPGFQYQTTIPISLTNITTYIESGFWLFIDTFRFCVGNLTQFQSIAACLFLMVFPFYWSSKPFWKNRGFWRFTPVFLVAIFVITTWAMFSIMHARHEPIVWDDVRRIYYWLPTVALIVFGLALLFKNFLKDDPDHKTRTLLIAFLMAIIIAGNIYALPEHLSILKTGHQQAQFDLGPALRKGLKNLDNPSYQPPVKVTNDKMYQFFKSRMAAR